MDIRLIAANNSPTPPPITGLRGAICIYVDGAPQFMDELELRTDAEQDHILDVYCAMGFNQICIGPAFAFQYDHHDLPPIDWAVQDVLPLFRKLRARGLHTTLALYPTDAPYWDGRTWDYKAFYDRYTSILEDLQSERLVDSIRFAWETFSESKVMVLGVQLARGIFPIDVYLYWHNPTGHDSPCLSDENSEQGWRDFLAAGANGLDLQCGTPYSRPDALEAMKYDLFDMRRRATGTAGSPWGPPLLTPQGVPMTVRNAEYSAYDVFHNHLPWSTAVEYGREGMTVPGPGDDTALDGI